MKKAGETDTVKIHYSVKYDDDQVFETSRGGSPLQFEIGSGSVLPRLEKEVIGMNVGDKKAFTLSPEERYGKSQPDLIGTVKKSSFPDHITPIVGQQLKIELPNGESMPVTVTDIEDENVTLDGNHPLAGHTVELEVEMMEIK
ncbi:MAG: peptidylprolyl isomerase [Desulfobacterales bacterium]|jgi:peptidylprolyl isomerase